MAHRVLQVVLNGEPRSAEVDTRKLLVEAVREDFGLPGTHAGCLTGDCGACTVEIDGRIEKSCLRLAATADGCEITTIEGLADADGTLTPIQEAFWEEYGFQCGFCLPGMLFAARDLLSTNQDPSDDEIRAAIDGNLCRCTGYEFIVTAIRTAAKSGAV